jgi:redox-sensitive bicupin YhaK (pirin superfamily)
MLIKAMRDGLPVRRYLLSAIKQAVDPFIFFDHFGPLGVAPGAINWISKRS